LGEASGEEEEMVVVVLDEEEETRSRAKEGSSECGAERQRRGCVL
jgi:hypothetical protein